MEWPAERTRGTLLKAVYLSAIILGCLFTVLGVYSSYWLKAVNEPGDPYNGLFEKCRKTSAEEITCFAFNWGSNLTGEGSNKIRLVQTLATLSGISVWCQCVVSVLVLCHKCHTCNCEYRAVMFAVDGFLWAIVICSSLSSIIFLSLLPELQLYAISVVGWSVYLFTSGWILLLLSQLLMLGIYRRTMFSVMAKNDNYFSDVKAATTDTTISF